MMTKHSKALWTIQGLLAALFLFAGGVKLAGPAEMARQSGMPAWFLVFIGVAEVLGAIGLVLPGLLQIKPELTPIAAAGLVIIMVGATVVTLQSGQPGALFPCVVGLLLTAVAYGRSGALRLRHACASDVSI